jgi:hypothetical protein
MNRLRPRSRHRELGTEGDQCQPPHELKGIAVVFDGARYGADAERRQKRNEAIAENGPEPGRDAAPEAALNRAMDTKNVDRPHWRGHKHPDQQSDRNNEGVRNKLHQHNAVLTCGHTPHAVSRNRIGSPRAAPKSSPSHITRWPRTIVPTDQPCTVRP